MLNTSDKITAIAVLDREQAMVVGFNSGKIELRDLFLTKTYDINTLFKIPIQTTITAISVRASQQQSFREKAPHTIVIIGDTSGNIHRFSIKRSTKSNGSLKVNQTGRHTSNGSPIHSSAILSEEDFALGYTAGIQICTCKIRTESKPLLFTQTQTPVALLPVTNSADFVAVFNDGTTRPFSASKKSKKANTQINTGSLNIAAIDGIITAGNLGNYSYTLAVLDQSGILTLNTNQATGTTIAINVATMTIKVSATQTKIAYITKNGELFVTTFICGTSLVAATLGTADPLSILVFDHTSLGVYAATNEPKLFRTSGSSSANVSPPPPQNLISFDNESAPAALTSLPTVAAPNNPYTTIPNPSNIHNSSDAGTHYQPIPGHPQQQRIPRIVTSTTGDQFLMFSKASIADTGASGAKLVLCRRLLDNKLVVVKKFYSQAEFAKEWGVSDDILATTRGAIRTYGWAEVKGRKNEQETHQTKYYLFMEHMTQGDGLQLRDVLQHQNLDIISRCNVLLPLANDLIQGLLYTFHQNNKYHLDIKPENFMLKYKIDNAAESYTIADLLAQKLEAKLVDFGESIVATNGQINSGKGDSRYMSPQRLSLYRYLNACGSSLMDGDLNRDFYYGTAEDAWALGVTLFVLLFGYNPFVYDVYLGRENFAGMNQQILTTCNYTFFSNKINTLMQLPFFKNSEQLDNPDANLLRTHIINLVNSNENRRITYLNSLPSLSSSSNYTSMPTREEVELANQISNLDALMKEIDPDQGNDSNNPLEESGLF